MKLDLIHGSRSRILAAAIFIIVAVFVVRLFYLQIIQHDHYVALANNEQVKRLEIPASRGLIYAKNGDEVVQLVMNEKVYTVFADPVTVRDADKIEKVLREVAGGNVRTNFQDLLDVPNSRYQILATSLTRVQADKIKQEGLLGIGFQEETRRVYPEGQLAGQVLGFVNNEGKGNYGVEAYLDKDLQGVDGRLESVTDVSDVPLTIGDRNVNVPAQDGKNVVLTIDRNVQSHVEQALADGLKRTGATHASAIVMDPRNGKVLSMANLPTYNPGEYSKVTDAALFNNSVISAPYEPGSDIKTYTMAAAIDQNVARASNTYNNRDTITVNDATIGNATRGNTGIISFQQALNLSLNTGFVTLAQRLGDGENITLKARQTIYAYFHDRLRLGQLTGIELANESAGKIFSPDEVQGNAVRYATMSFGQGLDATLLQVTAGFAPLVNGGDYYQPTVIDGYVDAAGTFTQNAEPTPLQAGVLKKETSDEMTQMTRIVRTSAGGQDKEGYFVGGKTGTSQVSENGRYSDTETIGTYLGFGGSNASDIQYVIMVSISGENQVLRGAQDAGPIFTDISNWMIDYLRIPPGI